MVLSRCTHRCSVGFQEKLGDGRYGKKLEGSCGQRGCPGWPAWGRSCERCWPAPSRVTRAWPGRGSENGQPPWWNKVALPKLTEARDSSLQDDEMTHWEERVIVTPWAGELAVKGYYQNISCYFKSQCLLQSIRLKVDLRLAFCFWLDAFS